MCNKIDWNFGITTTGSFTMTLKKTTEFVINNNMVIFPHPPYSLDLIPCDFALFPKLQMKLKGRRFETVSDSTELRKMTSTVLLKHGRNYGIAVYIPKETILKVTVSKIEYVKPAFLF
jgi:hypothetical protein